MKFKLGYLIISLSQFIGWEILFFNGIYEEEKNNNKNYGILSNILISF